MQASWRSLFMNDLNEAVCTKCKAEFESITGNACLYCGALEDGVCRDCLYWEQTEYAGLITKGQCLYRYNAAMQTYFHQYKFLQDVILSEVFAKEVQHALAKVEAVIVPIPMNPKKLKERTFAQVDAMLESARLPYKHLLTKNEDVQGKKTKTERMASAPLFQWNGEAVPKKVILVDDLYTTGTTMRHAAKVLKSAGAEEIELFCLIRG
ncbi:Ribose-phosphate pyrophosphokinase [Planococcus massiliensis]|uniref:Ribose-phosphate pyrophosphokinase n=2 Tax=Planococcus massiliensis TaxID=1499687 RepID=A0A098EIW3_9BACL|nr:Ribose-phosphate pyrophosphokinase [Planococcus massiliensis]